MTRQWLARLGLSQNGEVWKISSPPVRRVNGWRVSFRTAERLAIVDVDGLSGDLLYLRNRPIRSHTQGKPTLP